MGTSSAMSGADEHRSSTARSLACEALAIAIGGAIGASLRFAVTLAIRTIDAHPTLATVCVNLLGALWLGMLAAHVDSPRAHPLLRPFLVVGVFGSFTTFSALAFDNRSLASQHGELAALVHMLGSILAGLFAFALGASFARGRR